VKPPHAKIMVVDDHPDMRALLRQALEREGCEVCEAGDGRQALDLLDLSRPNMILLDLVMPGIGGFEFCENCLNKSGLEYNSARRNYLEGSECGGANADQAICGANHAQRRICTLGPCTTTVASGFGTTHK
jgi:CheY-like chemotaxis protein